MDPRVLVVDDDEGILRATARILGHAGYAVETAAGGQLALQLLRERRYDAVVSDIDMPGCDGADVLRAARDRSPEVPVVLMTGRPVLGEAIATIEHRTVRYLEKPVAPVDLCAAVHVAIQTASAEAAKSSAHQRCAEIVRLLLTRDENACLDRTLRTAELRLRPVTRRSTGMLFAHEVGVFEDGREVTAALAARALRLRRGEKVGRWLRPQVAQRPVETGVLRLVPVTACDLLDEELYDLRSPLSQVATSVALWFPDGAALAAITGLSGRLRALRLMGYRIALAGPLDHARPDFFRLDDALVARAETERPVIDLLTTLIGVCADLGIEAMAAPATDGQRAALVEAGCDLLFSQNSE